MTVSTSPRFSMDASLRGWPEEVVGVGQPVPVLGGGTRPYVNLDNAASTPPLVAVRDTVERFLPWYSSVHRGAGFKSQLSTHLYEEAREAVGRFVGADPAYHAVVFVKNTTEALNKVSHLVQASNAVVITSIMEHHANLLTWRFRADDVRYLPADQHGVIDLEALERQLQRAPTDRPRLVAVSGAYNVTGYTPPIHQIARLAHQYGARLLVDGAQLVPHRAVNLRGLGEEDRIDFLAFSGHKLYAPYGAGALIAPRDAFAGVPDVVGGGAVDLVTMDQVAWAGLPDREEAGSPNVVGAVALAAACQRLWQLGIDRLAAHEEALTDYALRRLGEVPGLRVLGPATVAERVGAIAFTVESVHYNLAAAALGHEWAVGVRAGCFCAHPGMLHLLNVTCERVAQLQQNIAVGCDLTTRPGAVRASLGLYNCAADVDLLVEGLEAIVAGHFSGRYVANPSTGDYVPLGWQPDFAALVSLGG